MAKWRRTVLGHAYDPTPDLDIHWSDEYASDDRDSEDLHSEPRSDDSDDDPTTDDDYEEPEPPLAFQEVVVEEPAGGTQVQPCQRAGTQVQPCQLAGTQVQPSQWLSRRKRAKVQR